LKNLFFFALLLALAFAARPRWNELEDYTFGQYIQDFNKYYSSSEFQVRKNIFEQRLEKIKSHNKDVTKTWKEGVNHLTDQTEEEFKNLLGYKKSFSATTAARQSFSKPYEFKNLAVPHTIDWRQQGIVSPVKDQGQCGSCWTFATAETVESQWALATGQLPVLSEQQILDCTPNPNQCGGTGGCGGGTAELAMAQIIQQGGLSAEWTYPYRSYWGQNFNCNFSTVFTAPVAKIQSYVTLPSNTYAPLLEASAHIGPIAISVDASAWQNYEGGVFDGCNKSSPDIDHAVQLVGYGTDLADGDYWLVRNSWAPSWGEAGYIRLRRSASFTCGTDTHPSDGTGCKDGPATVKVCGTCGILYDSSYPIIN